MTTIVTRIAKGKKLTHTEMDDNLINLNNDKIEPGDTVAFSNKTIDLALNTVTGSIYEFNNALQGYSFATIAGVETISNKTIDLTYNTLQATWAELNTAIADANVPQYLGTPAIQQIATWSGDGILSGSSELTYTGTTLTVNQSWSSGPVGAIFTNSADSTTAGSRVEINNGTNSLESTVYNTAFSTVGANIANSGVIESDGVGGLSIVSSNAAGDVRVYAGGNTVSDLVVTFKDDLDADFTGNILVAGNVDGRDVATDGTKLDGIEAGATTDQTSIVGITGTKAEFDTAVTDGNFLYVGDAPTAHTHLLAAGGTDVTATAAEVNLLDLSGLTVGWVLSADSATTASWKAPTGGDVTKVGTPVNNEIGVWTGDGTLEGDPTFVWDGSTLQMYKAENNWEAAIKMGTSFLNAFSVDVQIDDASQELNSVTFGTVSASATADDGRYLFRVDGSQILRIDDDGIEISGSIIVSSTVDGRDIATDGTKLDGIEAGATADQTSIVGITGTKAEFDTAVTDGNIMYIGDAPTSHTHTQSEISDVTAIAAELNLLDLSGLTVGWVLSADSATTASWKAPTGGGGNVTKVGTPVDNEIGIWTGDGTIEGDANFKWNGANGDLFHYDPVNDGNPSYYIGASSTERLQVQTVYASGTQNLRYVTFKTVTDSATAERGRFIFEVDGANEKLRIDDDGLDVTGAITATTHLGLNGRAGSATRPIYLGDNAAGEQTLRIENNDAGTTSFARVQAHNGTTGGSLYHLGTGYTTAGAFVANRTLITGSGAGGVALAATNAGGDLRFYTGGSADGDLAFSLNDTQEAFFASNVTMQNSGSISFDNYTTTSDHIRLYGDGAATGYGIGVESGTTYYRSNGQHRWYISTLADGGTSDFMDLSTSSLVLNLSDGLYVNSGGAIRLTEQADHAIAPAAARGVLWVRSDTPNILVFTDDAGTDWDLNTTSGAGDVVKVGTPVDNQLGIWTGDGTIEGSAYLTYDGASQFDFYEAVNDGNPRIAIGSAATERLYIQAVYDAAAQTLDYVDFTTQAASATANKGRMRFRPDDTTILTVDDDGIDVVGNIDNTGQINTQHYAVNDGNPQIKIGSSTTNELSIQVAYDTGAQTLKQVNFVTESTNAAADSGRYLFNVDGTAIFVVDDGGVDVTGSITATDDVLITENLGVCGQAGDNNNVIYAKRDQNDRTSIRVANVTSGTASDVGLRLHSSAAAAYLYVHSAGFTTAGAFKADGAILYSDANASAGLSLAAAEATAGVEIYAGGTAGGNLVAAFNADLTTDFKGGIDITGNIIVSGNVDGRDVATDGTKLDGITAGAIADIIEDTTPQLGGDLDCNGNDITDVHGIQLDGVPDTDHTANGPQTNSFNAGQTLAVGDLVYLNSSQQWVDTDADASATAGPVMLGIALAAATVGNPVNVALAGAFVRDDTWAWTTGQALYVSTTAGAITATAPSATGDIVRVIGYAVSADVIYFNPSGSWVEIA